MSADFSGANPADEDFTKLPIEARLASKIWKARVSAYEELSKAFAKTSSESDPIFRQYTRNPELLKSMVTDSNAVAQEKGVDAVRACVEFGGQAAGKSRDVVVPALVEKCLGSARAGTKKNALDLISFYAEMEDVVGCDGLLTDLLDGFKAKQPKIVVGCVTAIKDLLHDFGHKQVSPKPILKRLPDIFAHSDKNVRAEGSLLAQELHRYIGPALQPTIDSLKDIQAKELRQQFADIDAQGGGKPVPSRFLLSQREKIESAIATASTASAQMDRTTADDAEVPADDVEEDMDPYDLAEPVKVFSSRDFPADFEEAIVSKKWQDRKETLEAILKILTSSAKIHPDNRFDNLVEHLSLKIQKDANINVVLVSCQCLEAMAKGLREDFARYKDKVVPPIIEKLKEKKPAVVEVLGRALDAVFQTVSFSDILEHIFTGIKHKNPAVKTESILFLVRCLRSTKVPPAKGDIKPIGDALVTAIADGSPDVRDAGAAGLGTLMKLIGERPMNPFLEGLDDIKKAKIQEEFKVAVVRVKMAAASGAGAAAPRKPAAVSSAPQPRAAPPAAAKPRPVAVPAASGKENQAPRPVARAPAPVARAPIRPTAPSAGPSSAAKKPAAGKPTSGGKGVASATEPVKFKFHPDDAEAKAADLIPAGIASQLASGVWKERLAGMAEFNDWLKIEAETIEAEIIVRALGKKPGWKESNFQVMAEVYKALQMLASDCPTFGRPSVALSVQPLCDKLGDIKLKGPAGETLITYAEKTSFGFVLAQALGPLASLKAPKAIADSILWVDQVLLEFGTSGVDVRSLIDYLITSLKSANAAVRINATKAIGTLARFLGSALNSFLADLNPQLRTTIEGEIEKAAANPPPAPVRFSDETKAPASSAGTASNGVGAVAATQDDGIDEDMLDELIPRVDVDRLVSPATVARIGDSNWKERKEALEEILAIVNTNSRLKGSMAELANALRLRCSDSNIMCKSMSLDAIAKIASAMNKHFEPHAKLLAGPIAQVLGDAKAPVRASATAALTAIAEQVGAAPMLPGLTTAAEGKTANPMLKQELFAWLGTWFEAHPPEKGSELAPLCLPCLQCLDDKLAAVRKAAQSCLPYIIQRAGYKYVMETANQLKPASRTTVTPLIDAARAQAQALAKTSAPATALATSTAAPTRATAVPRNMAASSGRIGSPAPAAPASPKVSATVRPGGVKPPSAVGRSLKAPSSTIARGSRQALDEAEGARRKVNTASSNSTSQAAANTIDRSAPLLSTDPKAKSIRERREGKGQNWIAADGAPRPELTEALRQQCEGNLSRGLVESMFSKSHSAEKDYYAALTLLVDFISDPVFAEEQYGLPPEETIGRTLASSDLIFKYVAIRLTDNNTSLSLKCLEILEHLSSLLSEQQYHMSDYEAACILPCLTAKFGDAKVAFRDRIREIFRKMTFTFPPSKLVSCYMENGLPSKNARVRTECLGEIGYLFSKNGLQVCSPSRTLPVIAKQISDRDANVRTAALMTLGEAYKIIGDEIWKLVGSLPGKEMSLLEERLKRTSVPLTKPTATISPPRSSAATPATASPARQTSTAPSSRLIRPAAPGVSAPSAGVKSRLPGPSSIPGRRESAMGLPRPIRKSVGPADFGSEEPSSSVMLPLRGHDSNDDRILEGSNRSRVPSTSVQQELLGNELPEEEDDELSVDQAIHQIASKQVEQSIMALKHVSIFISEVEPQLIQHVDQLAIVLSKQVHLAFSPGSDLYGNERLKKHLIVVGTSLFDRDRTWEDGRTLGSYLSRSALIPLLTVLLQQLLQATSKVDDRGAQMESKYINTIVLRCFSACNLNLLYGACLSMLTEATEDLRELSGAVLDTRTKFSELVVKCLWKIAKRLQNSLEEKQVEAAQLYADVESFLQTIPPPEWKRRAQDGVPLGDLPLRTMKVILNNMTTHFGDDALSMLDMIPEPENSIVYSYVIRMLNANVGTEAIDDAANSEQGSKQARPVNGSASMRGSSNGENGSTQSQPQAATVEDSTHHAELRDIFQMISNKSQSRQGIRELYEFQKRNPQLEKHVENSLQKTGPIFQRFIKRALANHASEDLDAVPTTERDEGKTSAPLSASALGAHTTANEPVTPKSSRFSSAHQLAADPVHGSAGSPTSSANSPRSSSIRNPAADDRLAQLRAKFT